MGEGPYTRALAQILDAAILGYKQLLDGPAPNASGTYPRVLGALERVFLVAGTSYSAADLLCLHDAMWNWVEKLSPEGDQH
ncbi:MAG: hypothetical protein KDL87_12715, partial [Verrucomicrobiae bacterium]|nr:hypothetical protein [Verrucomicrobiae bacterium]